MVKLPEPFDANLWRVENAIREHRRPPTDALLDVLGRRGVETPAVRRYITRLNEGALFKGRKPITIDETVERLELARNQIRAEQTRARKSGHEISLTKAVETAARRPGGLSEHVLWEMVTHHRAHYDGEDIFIPP